MNEENGQAHLLTVYYHKHKTLPRWVGFSENNVCFMEFVEEPEMQPQAQLTNLSTSAAQILNPASITGRE